MQDNDKYGDWWPIVTLCIIELTHSWNLWPKVSGCIISKVDWRTQADIMELIGIGRWPPMDLANMHRIRYFWRKKNHQFSCLLKFLYDQDTTSQLILKDSHLVLLFQSSNIIYQAFSFYPDSASNINFCLFKFFYQPMSGSIWSSIRHQEHIWCRTKYKYKLWRLWLRRHKGLICQRRNRSVACTELLQRSTKSKHEDCFHQRHGPLCWHVSE